jgi:hypothetical protein
MPSRGVDTPIGTLGLVASERGLSGVRWSAKGLPDDPSSLLDEAAAQLEAYFGGELTSFELRLDLGGTEFQRRCCCSRTRLSTWSPTSCPTDIRGRDGLSLGAGARGRRARRSCRVPNDHSDLRPGRRSVLADDPAVRFWSAVKQRAKELLPEESVRPGLDYALTEVVRCKSREEVGVAEAAAVCSNRYLRETAFPAPE